MEILKTLGPLGLFCFLFWRALETNSRRSDAREKNLDKERNLAQAQIVEILRTTVENQTRAMIETGQKTSKAMIESSQNTSGAIAHLERIVGRCAFNQMEIMDPERFQFMVRMAKEIEDEKKKEKEKWKNEIREETMRAEKHLKDYCGKA